MDAQATTATTQSAKGGGFPPFKVETFPGQIFWLGIAFALLFVVMWRVAGPRIGGTLTLRRSRIAEELSRAETDRKAAEATSAAYQTEMVEARTRARALAEQNRERVVADVTREEAAADAQANEQVVKAEARLAQLRADAKSHIAQAAQEAAADIVQRLIGESISSADIAAVLKEQA
ncbi:MAG TPA: hypothetical protein VK779_00505 [Rhizomicrobium sp.]|jgi:F-type H+-transporting ATPase subunit b|nr:hypothetical protein [Rhizomicrobium sp.]